MTKSTEKAIEQLEKRYKPVSERKRKIVAFLNDYTVCSQSDGTVGMLIVPADCTLSGISLNFDGPEKIDIQMNHIGKLSGSLTHHVKNVPYNVDLDYALNRGDVLKFFAPSDIVLMNITIGLKVTL